MLGRHGFVAIRVGGVAEALQRLDNRTDVVLVDLGLPDGDGFELIYSIRAAPDVPIIVVTARSELQSKLRGLHLGADDYLVKPYDARELIARTAGSSSRHDRGSAWTAWEPKYTTASAQHSAGGTAACPIRHGRGRTTSSSSPNR